MIVMSLYVLEFINYYYYSVGGKTVQGLAFLVYTTKASISLASRLCGLGSFYNLILVIISGGVCKTDCIFEAYFVYN